MGGNQEILRQQARLILFIRWVHSKDKIDMYAQSASIFQKEIGTEMKTNLIDSLIILLSSTTLAVFVLWAAGELLGLRLFVDVPVYLKVASENVFAVLASGVGLSVLLFMIRRQISLEDEKHPPYVVFIVGLTFIFVLSIVLLAHAVDSLFGDENIDSDTAQDRVEISRSYLDSSYLEEYQHGIKLLINGPFFSHPVTDPLVLYHISDHVKGDSVEFHRSQAYVGRVTGYRINILGLCQFSESGQLAVLLSDWPGTPTIPGGLLSITFDNNTGFLRKDRLFDIFPDGESLDEFVVKCTGEQKVAGTLESDEKSTKVAVCECNYSRAFQVDQLAQKMNKIAGLWNYNEEEILGTDLEFRFSEKWGEDVAYFSTGGPIGDGEFSSLLDDLKRLPQDSGIRIVEKQSSYFEVVQVTYSNYWFSWYQKIFVKQASDNYWTLMFDAPKTSKGKSPARVIEFVEPWVLRVEMCTASCGYPGMTYGILDLKLGLGLATLVESKGIYFDGKPRKQVEE